MWDLTVATPMNKRSDLVVAVPVGDLDEHVELPVAQLLEPPGGIGVDLETLSEPADQPAGDRR